ncbi:hypothetical protein BdWA1_003354 [Babesia duncani]|uniref:Uncharacterized protein n=1 Tax=Babesia duncani TaxID=323732 RepID=A0AAD9UMM1_9APIC|nr:hypothetical protein BdWA1_003354 [Babesia duncani]
MECTKRNKCLIICKNAFIFCIIYLSYISNVYAEGSKYPIQDQFQSKQLSEKRIIDHRTSGLERARINANDQKAAKLDKRGKEKRTEDSRKQEIEAELQKLEEEAKLRRRAEEKVKMAKAEEEEIKSWILSAGKISEEWWEKTMEAFRLGDNDGFKKGITLARSWKALETRITTDWYEKAKEARRKAAWELIKIEEKKNRTKTKKETTLSEKKTEEEIEKPKPVDVTTAMEAGLKKISEAVEARRLANPGKSITWTEDEMKKLDEIQAQRVAQRSKLFT